MAPIELDRLTRGRFLYQLKEKDFSSLLGEEVRNMSSTGMRYKGEQIVNLPCEIDVMTARPQSADLCRCNAFVEAQTSEGRFGSNCDHQQTGRMQARTGPGQIVQPKGGMV